MQHQRSTIRPSAQDSASRCPANGQDGGPAVRLVATVTWHRRGRPSKRFIHQSRCNDGSSVPPALVFAALKSATSISQALITAGGLVSVLLNLFKRDPHDASRPLIDFQVALVLTPTVLVSWNPQGPACHGARPGPATSGLRAYTSRVAPLSQKPSEALNRRFARAAACPSTAHGCPIAQAGVAMGVLLNTMCPPWLITVLLILFVTLMVLQAFNKASGRPPRHS